MFAKLTQAAADQIVHIQEAVTPTKVKQDDNDDSPTSRKMGGTRPKSMKCLRSSSVLSRNAHSSSSLESSHSDASNSDSVRCNIANMPNKITGEMGLEIFPAPDGENNIVLRYVHDRHFQYIHPHVFAPACLTNVRRMGGGGSVAVLWTSVKGWS